eukprot:CAMPEP_0172523524 /NCGR_PEP_ID=MMETSP1066-20121228/293707_1 /TAXON_ID=671091 /ORGANISM="Coscinodiscus wailesii, Strain CCMP2513" /LENGTH=413 /DNA_ID=CAMNT_0013306603 /DNA_START=249 /DNA_END=1490 /DNA_ORIENTATION=+
MAYGDGERKQRYIRIKPSSDESSRRLELQTCVATFEKIVNGEKVSVDLHSQVHFGDETYFRYYNDPEFSSRYDRVHYELIISDEFLDADDGSSSSSYLTRRVHPPSNGLAPSVADSRTALQHGLACQVDVVDYTQPNWIHADFSRQELESLAPPTQSILPAGGGDVLQALIKPATPARDNIRTQLFSNLFLTGMGITSFVRSLLWMIPAPELSILLLDWSSLQPRPGGISPIASAVLECLTRGDFGTARTLVFSQMIVSGQVDDGNKSVIVGGRNERAIDVLDYSINNDGCQENALIYGGLHCRDLQRKLERRGYQLVNTDWRTAWTIPLPGKESMKFAVGIALACGYLGVSAVDWVETLRDTATAFEFGEVIEGFEVLMLYMLRHVVIYLSLAKFVVEWDGSLFGVGGDDKD